MTFNNNFASALIRCLSQPVKRIASAKPILEQAEEIMPLPMPLAKAFSAFMGFPAHRHITIPAPTSTILASKRFTSSTSAANTITQPKINIK